MRNLSPLELTTTTKSIEWYLEFSWDSIELPTEVILGKGRSYANDQLAYFDDSSDPRYRRKLSDMARTFHRRFTTTGDVSDLSEAIFIQKRIVDGSPAEDPWALSEANSLGIYLCMRFKCTSDRHDLDEAISVHTQILEAPSIQPETTLGHLINLGIAYSNRFSHIGDLRDLSEAIPLHRRALDLAASLSPDGHRATPFVLHNLGEALRRRFVRTGDLSDLTEALSLEKQGVSLTPDGDPELLTRLISLGSCYLSRFHRTENLQDLAEAILLQTQAVHLTADGNPNLPTALNELGASLERRFERTNDLTDLNEAISRLTQAVQLTPKGHRDLPMWTCNLSTMFSRRFKRTGDLDDLGEAIRLNTHAIELTPQGQADLPSWLNNLGLLFKARFERTGELNDLTESISLYTRAKDLTPAGHSSLPSFLTNLGGAFARLYERTKGPRDMEKSLSAHRSAVELLPEGHAHLVILQSNLASALFRLYYSTEVQKYLEEAVIHFRSAATSDFGSPRHRMVAANKWALVLNNWSPESTETLYAFDVAIRTVTVVVGLEQTIHQRHLLLREYSTLPLLAASAAFRLDRPDKVLEWLEQARCLVWGQQSQLRTPLDELESCKPTLASRFMTLSRQLEHAGASRQHSDTGSSSLQRISLEDAARSHVTLVKEWEDLLANVRSIKGFETFLQPAPCSSLMHHLPFDGPVVIINVQKDRCDAIALLAGREVPLQIALPTFSMEKAQQYRRTLSVQLRSYGLGARGQDPSTSTVPDAVDRALGRYDRSTGATDKGGLHRVLEGLWDEVVKPILTKLGYSVS
jgi:tetratricopeptide (TPR) repeat protein